MSKRVQPFAKFISYLGFFILVALFFILSIQQVFGQTEDELRAELERTEKELLEEQRKLDAQRAKSNIIQGEVNKLTSQINTAQKNIDAKASTINEIGKDIDIKDQTVTQLNDKLDRSTDILADLVRTKNQVDDISIVEVLLAFDNMSEFFEAADSIVAVQSSINSLLDQVRELRGLTEGEKAKLEEKKKIEQEQKAKIETEKQAVAVKQGEQKGLLSTSKATEAVHAQAVAEKQAKAAQIRSALFRLRDSSSLSFEDALAYAKEAEKATGVRASFILGILKQESNIGQNVGSCVITDLTSGSTKSVNSGTVFTNGIHPTRDLPVLQTLLKELGRDPLETRVSCPLSVGYGGAMGPSQFIPSTWQGYVGSLSSVLGAYPDPWNPRHAIMASGLFLRDLGAAGGAYSGEFEAAARYYAGGNWQTYGQGYAQSVMGHTATIQSNIDFLKEADSQ